MRGRRAQFSENVPEWLTVSVPSLDDRFPFPIHIKVLCFVEVRRLKEGTVVGEMLVFPPINFQISKTELD